MLILLSVTRLTVYRWLIGYRRHSFANRFFCSTPICLTGTDTGYGSVSSAMALLLMRLGFKVCLILGVAPHAEYPLKAGKTEVVWNCHYRWNRALQIAKPTRYSLCDSH